MGVACIRLSGDDRLYVEESTYSGKAITFEHAFSVGFVAVSPRGGLSISNKPWWDNILSVVR